MKTKNANLFKNDMQNDLIAELSVHLCNMYALSLRFQNFHWHVNGQNFKALHDLFEEQYKAVTGVIDDLAERIRTLDAYVPATLKAFHDISEIPENYQPLESQGMLEDAISACSVASERCVRALKIASLDCDEVTVDMLVQHQKLIEKAIWKFSSSLEHGRKTSSNNVIKFDDRKTADEMMESH